MPLIDDDMDVRDIPGGGGFNYSAVKMDKIDEHGAGAYSLITIIIDISSSTRLFAPQLLQMLKNIILGCQKDQNSETLMVRVLVFNSECHEIHGFRFLNTINVDEYEPFEPKFLTALNNVTFSGVGATLDFSRTLMGQDYEVNGVVYIVTDGGNNIAGKSAEDIRDLIENALREETVITSLTTVLIGLCDPKTGSASYQATKRDLEEFRTGANLTKFVDMGDASPEKLAKLGNIVVQHVSSVSQSLKSGGHSSQISLGI